MPLPHPTSRFPFLRSKKLFIFPSIYVSAVAFLRILFSDVHIISFPFSDEFLELDERQERHVRHWRLMFPLIRPFRAAGWRQGEACPALPQAVLEHTVKPATYM